MAMSLTLVNTSNWENEKYIVTDPKGGWDKNTGKPIPQATTLKPGESMMIYPDKVGTGYAITAVQENEKPFYTPAVEFGKMVQKQVMPKVTVTFE